MEFKTCTSAGGPEVGDTVYSTKGRDLGRIGFFYAEVRDNVWAVRLGDDEEDHSIIVVKTVPVMDTKGNRVGGVGLVRLNEAYVDNNKHGMKPVIVIENYTDAPPALIMPPNEETSDV